MTNTNKKAIFSMGLPGAGKSHTLNKLFNMNDFVMIDPDEIKKEKADYNPKQPEIYHEWSKEQANLRTARAIENSQNIIIDGTATNVNKMLKNITNLQNKGYEVTLLYVKVKLETAIERNSKRERVVPVEIILEKHSEITEAFEALSKKADIVTVVHND